MFTWYVDRNGGLEIVPGYYQLRHNDHMGNVLGRLRTPPDQTFGKVTFPEGFTIQQMADRLAEEQPRLTAAAFVAAANSPTVNSAYRPPGVTSIEGLLFPDTYQVSNADNEAQVIERMVTLMERVASQEDLDTKAAILGRTPYEILIVASMIEKEAKLDEDRPKIARVIYNRLFIEHAAPDRRHPAVRPTEGVVAVGLARCRHAVQHVPAHRGCHRRRSPTLAGPRSRPRSTRRPIRRRATRSARCCPTRPRDASTSTTCSPTSRVGTPSR